MEVQEEGTEYGFGVKIKQFFSVFQFVCLFVFSSSEKECCAELRRSCEGLRGEKV